MHSPSIIIDAPLVASPAPPSPAISLPGQEPPPPPPTNDGFDEGDIVLRSSDGVEFTVWRLILRLTSPVFGDMFSVGTAEDVIDLTDDAHSISMMLQFAYPDRDLFVPSFDHLEKALGIARKYHIDRMTEMLRQRLRSSTDQVTGELSPVAMSSDPIRAFAIARQFGLVEEAKAASTLTIGKFRIVEMTDEELHSLHIDLESAFILYRMHARREAVITETLLATNFVDHPASSFSGEAWLLPSECPECAPRTIEVAEKALPYWTVQWTRHARDELLHRPLNQCLGMFSVGYIMDMFLKRGPCPGCQRAIWDIGNEQWLEAVKSKLEDQLVDSASVRIVL
ncbi:The BTB (BR-C, ttk and bab)/POZ (Pox virus and Zinc finger) domain [Ceratobasidium sp. AG-Ba]|nr:The BTB (BR-C, ttk and bab)/POZ (Pox virus and Zinc finger) domain [Ceratobasidium sp. AG-Ba]QRW06628.1 The BTB (BR-C, ttk and bab)/POZ (Pox virus and Zinc finger) domain [Ceratobasidium sp. AG-Ba]